MDMIKIGRMLENKKTLLFDMMHKTEVAQKTFILNEKEYVSAQKFISRHNGCEHSSSAMSERFSYTFVPGGIGTHVSVKCLACKKIKHITDFDCW